MQKYKDSLRRRMPNRRCDECREELEFIDEKSDVAMCPKCFTVYDLRVIDQKKKDSD